MKIVHVSDIHIRNLKYHEDYRRVFEDLYRKLDEIQPDLVINTGDTAHTKTQISPEFVEMTSEHIRRVIEYAPYHIILGNHDLNLMNADRQDAITPIVESIRSDRVFLHKKSGLVAFPHTRDRAYNFWVFGIGDQENYPKPEDWAKHPDKINIGLFHGSVMNCVTDSNWRMTHTEHDLSIFEGLDYVLMGDIHKQQALVSDGRIAYAGSLIQQNFGEDIEKGFLFWDIKDKREFEVVPVVLKGSRPFVTVDLNEDTTLPPVEIPEDARVRVRPKGPITLVQAKAIERQVKKKYKPHDVIVLSVANVERSSSSLGKENISHENLRQLDVQERLIRKFLGEKGLTERVIGKVLDLNRKYQIELEQREETARNVSWKLKRIHWNNLFNFGEGNVVDFNSLSGLTGIFAPNASGKSNFIDVMMQTLFDSTTKGIGKNIFLINDNKEQAAAIAELEAENSNYILERTIERIKYGQKSGPAKEWGKTQINFYGVGDDGVKESLNGVSRPETERAVRRRLGTFDDFMLTGLFAQWNPSDIIQCKESERKRILYRFLDLDIFEQKGELAKKEAKNYYDRLRDLEDNQLDQAVAKCESNISFTQENIERLTGELDGLTIGLASLDEQIVSESSKQVTVDCDVNGDEEDRKIERCVSEFAKLEEQMVDKFSKLEEIEAKLSAIPKTLSEEEEKELEAQVVTAKEIQNKISVLTSGRTGLERDIAGAEKNMSLLKEVPCGDMFPQCRFLVNAFEGKKSLPVLQDKVEKVDTKLTQLREELSAISSAEGKLEAGRKAKADRRELLVRRDNVKLQLDNLKLKTASVEEERKRAEERKALYLRSEDSIKKNREVKETIARLQAEKSMAMTGQESYRKKISELTRKLGSDQGILETVRHQLSTLNDLRDLCTAYEHYGIAMGKDGIAFEILKQKLPLINEEINKILSVAAEFAVHIEHDPEEDSVRIYMQYGEYRRRLIELGSGAEKFLSSISIRNALMNISNLPKTDMFIIDEGFGKLDPKNMENINRMFDYLRTMFNNIIVISHSDVMKDMVDNIIDITADEEGYAHIEV